MKDWREKPHSISTMKRSGLCDWPGCEKRKPRYMVQVGGGYEYEPPALCADHVRELARELLSEAWTLP